MEMNGAVTWQMVLYVKLCNDFQETLNNASTAKAGNDKPLSYFIPNSIKVPAAMVKYTAKKKMIITGLVNLLDVGVCTDMIKHRMQELEMHL